MVGPAKKHVDELLKMSPDERSEAAELLLRSLYDDPEGDDLDAVAAGWASELERRIDEDAPGVSPTRCSRRPERAYRSVRDTCRVRIRDAGRI